MEDILIRSINNKEEWEDYLNTHREANFLQSWYWGEFHKRLKKQVIRTGFYQSDKLTGIMLSVVEPAKRGRYMTVPGGPVIDWSDKKLVAAVFLEMQRIGQENKCVFVRTRPQLVEDEFSKKIFKQYKCQNAPMHLHAELTSQLDISKTEEELMAQMRKGTRYEIRKGQKLGIQIDAAKDEKKIRKFYDLQVETSKRQHFVPFSYEFFHEQFKVFFEEDKALLYTAKLGNKILAQAFIIFYGDEAVYHYGASTEEGRKYPGAYLIQWEAILESKRRGMTRYNFWGIAPENETHHRFYGISIFKRGFGGEDVRYLHAQDLVIDPLKYNINLIIEKIRKTIRRV